MSAPEANLSEETFACNSCNVKFRGRIPFAQHLDATSHGKVDQRTFECLTCGVPMNSKRSFETHIGGSKHRRKLDKVALGLPAASSEATTVQPCLDTIAAANGNVIQSKGGEWKCELCDLACSSIEQFNTHLGGKKHTRRSRIRANSVQEPVQHDSSETDSSPVKFQSMPPATSASRKRALFSYTKAQLEGGLDVLRQLECATTHDLMNPLLSQLPLCMHKSGSEPTGSELECKRQHTVESDPSDEHVFCAHTKCMVARALKCYESTLRQLQSPHLNDVKPELTCRPADVPS